MRIPSPSHPRPKSGTQSHAQRSSRLARLRRFAVLASVPTLMASLFLASTGTAQAGPVYVPQLANVGSRHLLVSDEFTGSAGSSPNSWIWSALQGGSGFGNNEQEYYTARPSNVSLDGQGHLAITARRETYTGPDGVTRQFTSARIASKVSILYGYVEARIDLPAGQGLWPAFWTVGQDILSKGWPYSGEIDILEATNQMTQADGNLHGPSATAANNVYSFPAVKAASLAGGWHTYGIDWEPNSITWYLDGVSYATVYKSQFNNTTNPWEFGKPHLIQLNLAVGGNMPGSPDASTPDVSTMLVDYVRVYSTSGARPSFGYANLPNVLAM